MAKEPRMGILDFRFVSDFGFRISDLLSILFLTLPVFCVTTWGTSPQQPPFRELYEEASSPRTEALGEDVAVRITMEEVDTHPQGVFTTPVFLKTSPNIKLNMVAFEITYPKELSFSAAHKGFLLRSDRVMLETKTMAHASDSTFQVTTITVCAGEEGGKLALPDGLILYLDFRVSERVETRMVTLENKISGVKTVGGEPLPHEQLVAENPTVYILRSDMLPVSACFFYMH